MVLAVLLLHIWQWLRWLFTQRPQRGGRQLNVRLFQLSRFAKFFRRALESHYGCVRQITAVALSLQ
jgi:hypothetical protein